MRFTFITIFSLTVIFCSNASTMKNDKHYYASLKKNLIADTNSMLNPIPKELIVTKNVNDSDIVVIKTRCVVHSKYSENELMEIQKKCNSANEWEAFSDNYSFYNDAVSMFLYERALIITESNKKYILFMLATGDKIIIDRKKSAEKLFFFNPETGIKQCNSSNFDRRKYTDF